MVAVCWTRFTYFSFRVYVLGRSWLCYIQRPIWSSFTFGRFVFSFVFIQRVPSVHFNIRSYIGFFFLIIFFYLHGVLRKLFTITKRCPALLQAVPLPLAGVTKPQEIKMIWRGVLVLVKNKSGPGSGPGVTSLGPGAPPGGQSNRTARRITLVVPVIRSGISGAWHAERCSRAR